MSRLPHYVFTLISILILAAFWSCSEESQVLSKQINPHLNYLLKKNGSSNIELRTKTYTVGQSLDFLNDGMNLLYCRPEFFHQETLVFYDTLNIPISAGEIEEDDLVYAMDSIASFAGGKYYSEASTNKEPIMINSRQIFSSSPYFITIEAEFIMEVNDVLETEDEYPYEDSWIYGQWAEDVSEECSIEGANNDAVDLLRRDLRNDIVFRDGDYYFTNPTVICLDAGTHDCISAEIPVFHHIDESIGLFYLDNTNDMYGNNLYDALLFTNWDGYENFHECLSDDEMNFYYDSMKDLALGELPYPAGYIDIMQIEVGYFATALFNEHIWHSMLVIIATKNYPLDEALPLPIPNWCC